MKRQIFYNVVEFDFDDKFCHFILEQYKFTLNIYLFNFPHTSFVQLLLSRMNFSSELFLPLMTQF